MYLGGKQLAAEVDEVDHGLDERDLLQLDYVLKIPARRPHVLLADRA